MIEQIFTFLIIGIFLFVGVFAAVAPQVVKNFLIKYRQAEYNLYNKIPLLNKITEYNFEMQKSASLLAIRLIGITFIIFLILVIAIIF